MSGVVLLRHWSAAFMKHVFPILLRPHKPGLWLLNECLEFEFLTLEFEENPLKGKKMEKTITFYITTNDAMLKKNLNKVNSCHIKI